MRDLEPKGSQRGEGEIPKRNHDNVRWFIKTGCIVDNGSSVDVPVWISSDGLLVLPIGGNGGAKAGPGSRIRLSRSIWPICSIGDLGTVTGVGDGREDAPGNWLVKMDSGDSLRVFEGEFLVVSEQARIQQD